MTLREKQTAFLRVLGYFLSYVEAISKLELTGGELWRSNEEQARLLAAGLTKVKHSKHQDRTAIDFNIFWDGKLISVEPTDPMIRAAIFRLGSIWEDGCRFHFITPDWGGWYGVEDKDNNKLGWDFGHFGVK